LLTLIAPPTETQLEELLHEMASSALLARSRLTAGDVDQLVPFQLSTRMSSLNVIGLYTYPPATQKVKLMHTTELMLSTLPGALMEICAQEIPFHSSDSGPEDDVADAKQDVAAQQETALRFVVPAPGVSVQPPLFQVSAIAAVPLLPTATHDVLVAHDTPTSLPVAIEGSPEVADQAAPLHISMSGCVAPLTTS
jgi:hypothetical protein